MPAYELTLDAEHDLQDVARYTLNKWGRSALNEYRNGLKKTFDAIGHRNLLHKRSFSTKYPQLLVTKYQYHYIFFMDEPDKKPIVIGVIHERRDIVKRLSERLG